MHNVPIPLPMLHQNPDHWPHVCLSVSCRSLYCLKSCDLLIQPTNLRQVCQAPPLTPSAASIPLSSPWLPQHRCRQAQCTCGERDGLLDNSSCHQYITHRHTTAVQSSTGLALTDCDNNTKHDSPPQESWQLSMFHAANSITQLEAQVCRSLAATAITVSACFYQDHEALSAHIAAQV